MTLRMRRVARGRLRRKLRAFRRLLRAAEGDWDAGAYALFLQEFGRGGNRPVMTMIARTHPYRTLPESDDPSVLRAAWDVGATEEDGSHPEVSMGPDTERGKPRRPANRLRRRLAAAAILLARWRSQGGPAAALGALVEGTEREALAALQIAQLLGRERARQLLVDVGYVVALAARPDDQVRLMDAWMGLGGARYHASEALRRRLTTDGFAGWRNGHTQALLEVERCYCRQGACAICPLVAGTSAGVGGRRGVVPSPNADWVGAARRR